MPTRMPSTGATPVLPSPAAPVLSSNRSMQMPRAASGAFVFGRPRIVAAEPPQMALGVAAHVAAAAVILVGDFHLDRRAGRLGARVMRVGVVDDHAGALRLAHADIAWLDDAS